MLVLKFGGSSVANAENIKKVTDIVCAIHKDNPSCFVVVSAFQGTTDLILQAIQNASRSDIRYKSDLENIYNNSVLIISQLLNDDRLEAFLSVHQSLFSELSDLLTGICLLREASQKATDLALSYGERVSACLLNEYLIQHQLNSKFVDARDYIKTYLKKSSRCVHFETSYHNIYSAFNDYKGVAVITGFISSDLINSYTTTLGRGGSDYTASLFANALNAEELQIWTDVSGVMSADPRKVKKAYTILELSYSEALELSHFGAKVLYAPTVHPVREKNIPIKIKNTFYPEHPGTLIHATTTGGSDKIAGVSAIENIALLTLEGSGLQGIAGIAKTFFTSLAQASINVIMITQASSEHSITVAISQDDSERASQALHEAFDLEIERRQIDKISLIDEMSLVAIVGENMKNKPGVAGRLFNTLGHNGINIEAIAQGSSELNISFAIERKNLEKTLNTIHDSFFLSKHTTLHLFVVGTGLVGKRLISFIESHHENIKNENLLDIRLHGISNSKKMILSDDGLEYPTVLNRLEQSETTADLDAFVDFMINCNYANTVFVDNTASAIVPGYYAKILSHSIAISTPNKQALSSSIENYDLLKRTAFENNTTLNFETNVGAGLPIISTLHNLLNSGDKVIKIEAVLSGSMSFIYNNYNSSISFTELVQNAKDQGFTEPDPREDLSGMDIKRKLLILARESGFMLNIDDILFENWISDSCMQSNSIDEFYKLLAQEERVIQKLVNEAEKNNQKISLIASVSTEGGNIALRKIDSHNIFYNLSGSDNMIAYYTNRYKDNPLIVRGPGAGADVTAAGILAEIINLGN